MCVVTSMKNAYEVIYMKPGKFIFTRMAAILNQMNIDHTHHPIPLKPILILHFDLRLLLHNFLSTFPLPCSFYLPRLYHHTLFDKSKNITGWTVWGSNPSTGKIFRPRSDWARGPHNLLYNGYRPGCDIDQPPTTSVAVEHE
jgi:hypothetical protein